MSLESFTGKIKDLVITNPTGADPRSQGDDHLRGIKWAVQNDAVSKTDDQVMTGNLSVAGGGTGAQVLQAQEVEALIGQVSSVPTGTILDFAGATPPAGFLPCDGAAVSRTTYAALFAAIGVTWGAGDTSSTFNVPDLRRRTTIGAGGTAIQQPGPLLGNVGGTEQHTLTLNEMPSHNHASGAGNGAGGQYLTGTAPMAITPTGFNGGGQPHNSMQPSAVVNKIIKT